MKKMRTTLLTSLLLLTGAVSTSAQDNFDRWWTPAKDALAAAPQHHKVLFENEEVRVIEVTVAPHAREPLHAHRYPSVIYLESSAHLIEHLEDGTSADTGNRPDGVARWLPVAQAHA